MSEETTEETVEPKKEFTVTILISDQNLSYKSFYTTITFIKVGSFNGH